MAQNFTDNKVYEVVNLADKFGNQVSISSANFDSFARMRTSTPFTIGDYTHVYGLTNEFFNITSGTGATITHLTNKSAAAVISGTGTSSFAIHQTKRYHNYFPGKAQLILCSFVFGAGTTNVTKRIGYFDNSNGIYLEQAGTTLNLVVRTNTSGTVQETRVPQSQWNRDKCDGTGPSKFVLDPAKTELFFITFQWLGVGIVKCGFDWDGVPIFAHEFTTINDTEDVYIKTPTLPVRSEVSNSGTVSTGNSMRHICSTVISEGGYENSGEDWAISTNTLKSIGAGVTAPVLAIRLKNTVNGNPNRVTVKLNSINVFSSGANVKFTLVKLENSGFITGGSWNSVNTTSVVEYNESMTSWIDGEPISAGYVAADTQGGKAIATTTIPAIDFGAKKNYITQNYDSTDSQIFLVYAQNISSVDTTLVGCAIVFREIY